MLLKNLTHDNFTNIFDFLQNSELKNVIITEKKYYAFSQEMMYNRKIRHAFNKLPKELNKCPAFNFRAMISPIWDMRGLLDWFFDRYETSDIRNP
jgi:hypothetical protein